MSWFFGIISRENLNKQNLPTAHTLSVIPLNGRVLTFASGGNETTLFHSSTANSLKWAVSGVGINNKYSSYKLMDQNDWDLWTASENHSNQPDGHFAAITKNNNLIALKTDKLGLRDIYLYHDKDKIVFSTHIDLLSKYIPLQIDFSQFGGRWILLNQLSVKSIFKNVIRITAGAQAGIDLNSFEIKISKEDWLPGFVKRDTAKDEICKIIESLISFPIESGMNISLSLSGGLDSRIILAYLLRLSKTRWNTHTFGDPMHPDSLIAKSLAANFNFSHESVFRPNVNNYTIDDLGRFSASMNLNTPATACLQMDNYFKIKNKHEIIIDGGFGEILRREFLNKLLWRCKGDLMKGNSEKILPFMKLFRADIFNEDIVFQMETGALQQLSELLTSLPSLNDIEIEDWLDLFSIKTRLPNYYGPDQTRLDGIHVDFMPFAQLSFLSTLFSLPIKYRRNGKLSKENIRKIGHKTAKTPLAKGNTIIPFFMNSFQSRAWSLLQRKFNNNLYKDTYSADMLIYLKEYILDIVNSKTIRENSLFNYRKVKNIADGFYSGKLQYTNQLDWWLAFHLFYKQNNLSE